VSAAVHGPKMPSTPQETGALKTTGAGKQCNRSPSAIRPPPRL
jgi:hypothetical protein